MQTLKNERKKSVFLKEKNLISNIDFNKNELEAVPSLHEIKRERLFSSKINRYSKLFSIQNKNRSKQKIKLFENNLNDNIKMIDKINTNLINIKEEKKSNNKISNKISCMKNKKNNRLRLYDKLYEKHRRPSKKSS